MNERYSGSKVGAVGFALFPIRSDQFQSAALREYFMESLIRNLAFHVKPVLPRSGAVRQQSNHIDHAEEPAPLVPDMPNLRGSLRVEDTELRVALLSICHRIALQTARCLNVCSIIRCLYTCV